jgi:hypothetical protein
VIFPFESALQFPSFGGAGVVYCGYFFVSIIESSGDSTTPSAALGKKTPKEGNFPYNSPLEGKDMVIRTHSWLNILSKISAAK